jgi:hypothetical protein
LGLAKLQSLRQSHGQSRRANLVRFLLRIVYISLRAESDALLRRNNAQYLGG